MGLFFATGAPKTPVPATFPYLIPAAILPVIFCSVSSCMLPDGRVPAGSLPAPLSMPRRNRPRAWTYSLQPLGQLARSKAKIAPDGIPPTPVSADPSPLKEVALTVPTTSRLALGLVVPMPTYPFGATTMRGVPAVKNLIPPYAANQAAGPDRFQPLVESENHPIP